MNQRNFILALVLSAGIMVGWNFLFPSEPTITPEQQISTQSTSPATPSAIPSAPLPVPQAVPTIVPREQVIESTKRISVRNDNVKGSINLIGARFDDLILMDYRETTNPKSPHVVLLSPAQTAHGYFAEFNWVSNDETLTLPNATTTWEASADALTPDQPVTLSWTNPEGIVFKLHLELDQNYMFEVTQEVINTTNKPLAIAPYSLIGRLGEPEDNGLFILHEGPIGYLNQTLEEIDYEDLEEDKTIQFNSTGGWLGITDKYWLTTLIPDQSTQVQARFTYSQQDSRKRFQTDFIPTQIQTIEPGQSGSSTSHFFAGAKKARLLDAYSHQLNIEHFDLAIDFGWFYFLTKPIFLLLLWLHQYIGNMGVCILVLTIIVKIVFYPLASKSYRAMAKMKNLQPKLMKLRETYKNDKARMHQEMMALYKKEKVNPAAGCLPMIIQIPVFFALYKVLVVSIEMRHAPFFGWIKDLSAPDPTSIFNLFGLLPYTPPEFLTTIAPLGLWPIIMGITMYVQQKMNPPPADPVQAKIFMLMPIFFTFLLGNFAAGLVIYWTWNNVLSIGQQWIIMRRHSPNKAKTSTAN